MAKTIPSSPSPTSTPLVQPPTISDSSTTTLAIPVPVAIPLSKSPLPSKSTSAKSKLPHAHTLLSKAKTILPFVKAPPKFHRFKDLPNELRLKIWEATIEHRVHELHPCSQLYQNRMTFRSNSSSTPSIFHACHQSRLVALSNYRLMEYTPSNTAYLGDEEGATGNGKGILRFYFAPDYDTLLLNSLMGLFVMFMLLEDNSAGMNAPPSILSTGGPTAGVMKGWKRVAIDAERAQLITLLSGINGHSPQPGFKKLLPDLRELVIAFDYTRNGKTRFRTSVWPGEDGTTLVGNGVAVKGGSALGAAMDECLGPLRGFLRRDYGRGGVVEEGDAIGAAGQGDEIPENANADEILVSKAEVGERDDRDVTLVDPEEGVPNISVARVRRKRYVRGDLRYAFRWSCSLVRVRPRGIFRRL